MEGQIYCLVDAGGTLHMTDGARSYAEVAADCLLDDTACHQYRFDLTDRQLVTDCGGPPSDGVARTYMDHHVGTPERLMTFAAEGHLPKQVLLNLVTTGKRQAYVDACAVIEKKYTDDCAAKNDPCLESGCAVQDEICLEPLLRAGIEYHKACAAEWIKMFVNPRHRIEIWRH